MSPDACERAARVLWQHSIGLNRLDRLPSDCWPTDRAEAYAVQAALARLSGQPVVGWKIAATGAAGQAHIGVDGPLAGRLLRDRVLEPEAVIPLTGNSMRVAEVEFAFRMAQPLPMRDTPYALDEVMAAVATLHLSVEIPDSRYVDFARVGAPHLIADNACASWLVVGPPVANDWRALDLSSHAVSALIGGRVVAQGTGGAVLGDPRVALAWLANELRQFGPGLQAGDIVTTGTCITPAPIAPGNHFVADYGGLGQLALSFSRIA